MIVVAVVVAVAAVVVVAVLDLAPVAADDDDDYVDAVTAAAAAEPATALPTPHGPLLQWQPQPGRQRPQRYQSGHHCRQSCGSRGSPSTSSHARCLRANPRH